jgi:hypothetical protein
MESIKMWRHALQKRVVLQLGQTLVSNIEIVGMFVKQ